MMLDGTAVLNLRDAILKDGTRRFMGIFWTFFFRAHMLEGPFSSSTL